MIDDKIYWTRVKTLLVKEGIGRKEVAIYNAKDCFEYAKKDFEGRDRECFIRYDLNAGNRLIGKEIVSIGTANSAMVHPREVFKGAILNTAIGIIICHNHLPGDTTPSPEDHRVTDVIKAAGKMIGIDVLDHIIIGNENYYSFTEES